MGKVFPRLVDELERPDTPDGVPAVLVRVVAPAAVPDTSSSTGLPLTLVVGLLGGLAVGIGAAMARNALDTSVKSVEQLREVTGAPNLGTIAFDPDAPKRPLTVHADPQSPRAEAFRRLRTNLRYVDVDNPRKVILVTSSLAGEGKTTTLANLGIALASAGHRVVVVEADLRRPTLADILGLDRGAGVTSVLSGQVGVQDVIQHGPGAVDLVASGPLPPNPSELLASQQMQVLIDELRERYDTVLVDAPPILPVTDAAAVAPTTDGVILVCRYRETTRDQVAAAAEALSPVSAPLLGTVFTMAPNNGISGYQRYRTFEHVEHQHESIVPLSPAVVDLPVPARPALVEMRDRIAPVLPRPSPVPRSR